MENKPVVPKIALSPVKSSQITAIGHDKATNTLAIQFKGGGLYHYAGVDEAGFNKFKGAESLGKHFGAHIKKLPTTKIPTTNHG